ncbi:MAG: glycosyltransferase [Candidatus Moranbacteria bacterium]|nr:glycosyltransferase [Candidatus Moranbacteria bacterium]
MPKVSVVLLTYKSNPSYLKKSIESALRQSFKDFELLIIDDGPGNYNFPILEKFLQKDKRVKIIKNVVRLGRLKSRNLGLKNARGKYVAVLDSDDYWCDRSKLKKQVKFLDQHLKYGAVGTAMYLIDKNGKKIGQIKYPIADHDIRKYMLSSFQLAHPSVLIRKKAAGKVGGYPESRIYKFAEDYDFFLRVGQKYKLANLSEYCLCYRVHQGSGSINNEFKQKLTSMMLTAKYFGQYPKGTSALIKKVVTIMLPRSTMDSLITRNKFLKMAYQRLSGINKKL